MTRVHKNQKLRNTRARLDTTRHSRDRQIDQKDTRNGDFRPRCDIRNQGLIQLIKILIQYGPRKAEIGDCDGARETHNGVTATKFKQSLSSI